MKNELKLCLLRLAVLWTCASVGFGIAANWPPLLIAILGAAIFMLVMSYEDALERLGKQRTIEEESA